MLALALALLRHTQTGRLWGQNLFRLLAGAERAGALLVGVAENQ